MTDDRKGRETPEEKARAGSPENKVIGHNLRPETSAEKAKRRAREATEGKEGTEGEEPTGTVHLMEEEMKAAALDKQPGAANEPPAPPSVIHLEELRMKGEAIEQYLSTADRPDNVLPEEPLPGKPPEPPLGGEGRSGSDRAKATQYPASSDRRGRR